MTTDWEAAYKELSKMFQDDFRPAIPGDSLWYKRKKVVEGLIAKHTHRTEEDLPRDAWPFIKTPWGLEWELAYFDGSRVVTHAFTLDGAQDSCSYLNGCRLELEIGPRIQPPEES